MESKILPLHWAAVDEHKGDYISDDNISLNLTWTCFYILVKVN